MNIQSVTSQVLGASPGGPFRTLAAGSGAPGTMADSTSLSPAAAAATPPAAPVRPLWAEAASLGLLASSGAVSGPIGQTLSAASQKELRQVVEQLSKDFQFSQKRDAKMPWQDRYESLSPQEVYDKLMLAPPQNLDLKLYVVGKDVEYSQLDSLSEIQALDAFYNTHDLAHLPRPELAVAVQHLSGKGTFYAPLTDRDNTWAKPGDGNTRRTGQFGAYKEITNPSDENLPLMLTVGSDDGTKLHTEQDLEALSFFKYGGPPSGLPHADLAQAIVNLEKQGYSFHRKLQDINDMQLLNDGATGDESAADAWKARMKSPSANLVIGVSGIPIQEVGEEAILDPTLFGSDLKALKNLYDGTLKPLVDSKKINSYNAGRIVKAVLAGVPGLSREDCWRLLDDLRQSEARWVTPDAAIGLAESDMAFLKAKTGKDEDLKDTVSLYKRLVKDMVQKEAQSVFGYVRGDLKLECFNNDDFAKEKERFLTLAGLVGNFQGAKEAREVLNYDLSEPYEQRLEILERLSQVEKKLTPPPAPETSSDHRRRGDESEVPASPSTRILDDYKLVLGYRNPGQSLSDAAEILEGLESTLFQREGWKAVRDTFVFIQKGVQANALQGRTAPEAVRQILETYLLTPNLTAARESLLQPRVEEDNTPKDVKQADGSVTIGGVKVPIKA